MTLAVERVVVGKPKTLGQDIGDSDSEFASKDLNEHRKHKLIFYAIIK